MSLITYIAIYFIVWWTTIFAVLPFGVRSQHESGTVEQGTEPGAPVRPRLVRAAIITTILSAVLGGVFAWAVESGHLTLEMFPMPFDVNKAAGAA
jgi:predicted secreted protein